LPIRRPRDPPGFRVNIHGVVAGDRDTSAVSERGGFLEAILEATHLVVPDDLPELIDTHGRKLGARASIVYLVDLDQCWLVPLGRPGGPAIEAVSIEGTVAGRAYRTSEIIDAASDDGEATVWVPIVDGVERLGVLQLLFGADPVADRVDMRAYAGLIAELVMTKDTYGDFLKLARRRQPITVASELLWQLLPPLTFGTDELVISAAFVPTHDLGGDAFDYGVNREVAQIGIFDAMGHGFDAGILATAAIAAYRNGRRRGLSVADIARETGAIVEAHFGDRQFVTGILTAVEIATGDFTWCVAGHPPPLLLRNGRVVKTMDPGVGMPFGLGPASDVFHEQLEPGDRIVLYTDGVTEARTASGEFFGVDRLVDTISRTAAGDSPPEAMRRLMHAIQDHHDGNMRDDATVVMIEWRGEGGQQLEV
jgi:hypothetical protein